MLLTHRGNISNQETNSIVFDLKDGEDLDEVNCDKGDML